MNTTSLILAIVIIALIIGGFVIRFIETYRKEQKEKKKP